MVCSRVLRVLDFYCSKGFAAGCCAGSKLSVDAVSEGPKLATTDEEAVGENEWHDLLGNLQKIIASYFVHIKSHFIRVNFIYLPSVQIKKSILLLTESGQCVKWLTWFNKKRKYKL